MDWGKGEGGGESGVLAEVLIAALDIRHMGVEVAVDEDKGGGADVEADGHSALWEEEEEERGEDTWASAKGTETWT